MACGDVGSWVRSLGSLVLCEGSIIERMKRGSSAVASGLHPVLANALVPYYPDSAEAMAEIYRSYLAVGKEFDLPMFLATPTWRASIPRLKDLGETRDVNGDAVAYLRRVRESVGSPYKNKVYIGGLLGCAGDAYAPQEALSTENAILYHLPQAEALKKAGVDFLIAETLPALSEAKGIAAAMGRCGLPYIVSFVVLPSGTLLDGTTLEQATHEIDQYTQETTKSQPQCFLVNCTHPSHIAHLLTRGGIPSRVVGILGNGSRRSPFELDGAAELDSENASLWASEATKLANAFTIFGGCCGTDDSHIRATVHSLLGGQSNLNSNF